MPLRLLLALAGGLALWLSFPGYDVWPAAPVGVALWALAARDVGARRGAALVGCGALAFLIPTLSWSGIFVGAVPWLGLAGVSSAYYLVLGAVLGGVRVRDRWFPLLVGTVWITVELARSTVPYGGFPWARLAFSQADSPFARVAALLGAPGVSFAVALAGGALAVAVLAVAHRWSPGGRDGPARGVPGVARTPTAAKTPAAARTPAVGEERLLQRAGFVAAPLLAAVALVLGPLAIPTPTDGPEARFVAIQGNVPQAGLDFNAQRRAVLDNHARVTRQAARDLRSAGDAPPDLVVWPENASDIDPLRNPDADAVIQGAVEAVGAPVVVGAVLSEPTDHLTNAALLYEPGRSGPTQRYDKRHPAPFAEYIPQRAFWRLFSDKVDYVRRDFVGGSDVGVLRTPRAGGAPEVAAGTNICFEVAYDDLVRDGVTHGANVIIVQTNNATFGDTDESVQQLAISRIRAIEHGRSVVHISNVGVSALITPDGVAHGSTGLFEPAVLAGGLPLRSDTTLATRIGDGPSYLAAAGTALILLRRARARRSAPGPLRSGIRAAPGRATELAVD